MANCSPGHRILVFKKKFFFPKVEFFAEVKEESIIYIYCSRQSAAGLSRRVGFLVAASVKALRCLEEEREENLIFIYSFLFFSCSSTPSCSLRVGMPMAMRGFQRRIAETCTAKVQ